MFQCGEATDNDNDRDLGPGSQGLAHSGKLFNFADVTDLLTLVTIDCNMQMVAVVAPCECQVRICSIRTVVLLEETRL